MFRVITLGFLFAIHTLCIAETLSPQRAKLIQRNPNSVLKHSECYNLNASKIAGVDQLVLQLPTKHSSDRSFAIYIHAFQGQNSYWVNGFNCIQSNNQPRNKSCVGHDDSGKFSYRLEATQITAKIRFISLGDPDEPGPVISSPEGRPHFELVGEKIDCP